MSFEKKEYQFLVDIGVGPTNCGCYINGQWKARGSVVSSLNPSNNQVSRSESDRSGSLNPVFVSELLEFTKMFLVFGF